MTSLGKLIALLESRVGDPISGYWGTVRVDDTLKDLLLQARSDLDALVKDRARLSWLHRGSGEVDSEGYEWGVARVKFDDAGQPISILWTDSDHKDLDREMNK